MRPKLASEIQILNVALGAQGSANGGRYTTADAASVTVRIVGESSGVFAVVKVETDDVVIDPDGPHGHPIEVLQTALVVNGTGPIDVFAGQAILVFLKFSCPSDPAQGAFRATAILDGLPAPNGISILATARLGTVVMDNLTSPPILPGQTQNYDFQLISSLGHDVNLAVEYDSVFEPHFSAPTQSPLFVRQGAIEPLTIPITCVPETLVGNYSLSFRLRNLDKPQVFAGGGLSITVTRSVTVVTNLPSDLQLNQGDSVLCEIRVTLTAGPAHFAAFHGQLPAAISVSDGQEITVADTGFVGLTISIGPDAPAGNAAPLTIFWTVNETENMGELVFNISVKSLSTLIIAWRGVDPDKRLFWATLPDAQGDPLWSEQHSLDDRGSAAGPALAEFKNKLFMAWRGIIDLGVSERRLFYASHDGTGWSPHTPLSDRGSNYGPALATFRDKLYMAWRGVEDDQRLFWAAFPDPSRIPPWSDQVPLDDRGSRAGPSLAVFQDKLFMAWRGVLGDQGLHWSTFEGQSWSDQLPGPAAHSLDGPSLGVLGARLYMVWRGGTSSDVSDQRVSFSIFQGGTGVDAWSPPEVVQFPNGPLGSSSRPGVAPFDHHLIITTVGLVTSVAIANEDPGGDPIHPGEGPADNRILATTFDGPGNLASFPRLVSNSGTSLQPALCLFQGPFPRLQS